MQVYASSKWKVSIPVRRRPSQHGNPDSVEEYKYTRLKEAKCCCYENRQRLLLCVYNYSIVLLLKPETLRRLLVYSVIHERKNCFVRQLNVSCLWWDENTLWNWKFNSNCSFSPLCNFESFRLWRGGRGRGDSGINTRTEAFQGCIIAFNLNKAHMFQIYVLCSPLLMTT